MSFVSTAKDVMLNALTITQMSAHTAFPGGTGASEVSGTGYARVAATFAASAAGVRNLGASASLTIPTGVTVRWLGLWNGSTFIGYSPNAGVPKEFIAAPATDTFTCPAHGYVNTNKVVIYGDTVPAGLIEGTVYYVVNATADTFQVAATPGGSPIDITSAGGSACVVSTITEEVYGGGGTHTISGWTLALPN